MFLSSSLSILIFSLKMDKDWHYSHFSPPLQNETFWSQMNMKDKNKYWLYPSLILSTFHFQKKAAHIDLASSFQIPTYSLVRHLKWCRQVDVHSRASLCFFKILPWSNAATISNLRIGSKGVLVTFSNCL